MSGRRARVDAETRHGAEFGALLHDVGKIRIPNANIHKRRSTTRSGR